MKANKQSTLLHDDTSTSHQQKKSSTPQQNHHQQLHPQHQHQHQPDYSLSNAIQFEVVMFLYLTAQVLIQFYNIYRTNFYNYDFLVLMFALGTICMRLLFKYTSYVFQSSIADYGISNSSINSNSSSLTGSSSGNISTAASTSSDKKQSSSSSNKNAKRNTSDNNSNNNNNSLNKNDQANNADMYTVGSLLQQVFRSWQQLLLSLLVLALSSILIWLCAQILIIHNLVGVVFTLLPLLVYLFVFYGIAWLNNKRRGQILDSSDNYWEKKSTSSAQKLKLDRYDAQPTQLFKSFCFDSFQTTYYSTIFPLGFVGDHIYYDKTKCTAQILFVLGNMTVLLGLQLLSACFFKFLCHKQMFGYWRTKYKLPPEAANSIKSTNNNNSERIENWSPKQRGNYRRGNLIKYKNNVYEACGSYQNCGIPGDFTDRIIYVVFDKPERFFSALILLQGVLTVTQLVIFIRRWTGINSLPAIFSGGGLRSMVFKIFSLSSYWDVQWDIYLLMLLFHYYIFYLCVLLRKEILKKSQ